MIHQLDTFTEARETEQFACAICRLHPHGNYYVTTSNVGTARSLVETYAARQADAHPDWIVWVVTRTLVTPAWSLA